MALGDARAGDGLVGEDRDAGVGELPDQVGVLGAVEEADEDLALLHHSDLVGGGACDLDYEVGLAVDLPGVADDRGPGLLVVPVEVVVAPGPRLNDDLEPFLDEPADGLGHQPDPAFSLGDLLWNPYPHTWGL